MKIAKLIFSTLLFYFTSHAQHFDSALAKLNNQYKQEKLYLHFDRSVYNPGETMWFKAYLFTGNYPSLISKTMYAELVDDKGKVIDRKTAPLLSSSAASSFDLPENLTSTVVYVRAYTKWMLNFDSSFIYSKAIAIIPRARETTISPASSRLQINRNAILTSQLSFLQFFPEGGDLAEGVECRLAFKATDHFGMPINVNGTIVDKNGKTITTFTSVHDGMGTFLLQPAKGEQYKAIWKDRSGQTQETMLPVAKQNGVALEVNSNALQIEYKIKRSENNPAPYPYIFIIAQMNQQLLYRAKVNIAKNASASSIIPTENFPTGIVQVTLFTPDEKPIAERLVFVNQFSNVFNIDLNATLKDIHKKKKNILQIDVPDTFACNLSISVTDADLNSIHEPDNIFSHLFLSADIKGYVNDPAYYFSGNADSLIDQLDLVMMTNGWRRFNWENILANKWPELKYNPENYIAIDGQVHGLNKTLLANKELNAIIVLKNKRRDFLTTPVDPTGKFSFPDMVFYDTAKFFYQFNNDKKKELTSRATFRVKNNFLNEPLQLKSDSSLLLNLVSPDTAILTKNIEIYKEQLNKEELVKIKTLKTVTVTTKKKTKQEIMDDEYTSGAFSGGNSRTILPEDDPAFLSSQNLLNYLQGRIAGLQVDPGSTENAIIWRGEITSLFINEVSQQSISFITGKIAEDATSFANISMSDVAMVKIFEPPFYGAWGAGPGGAISVYLKKGITKYETKGLDYAMMPGYSSVKEFYSPKYTNLNSDSTDYRKTLYWNPFVVTDKDHRSILIPFYNNDITTKMKVIIEGCNADGKLTRVEKVLQ